MRTRRAKVKVSRQLTVLLALLATASVALAAACETEDFETRVSGESECLLMRRYGPTEPAAMIVWVHGNVSVGGPANSHFRLAEKAAADHVAENILAVALVRPGYPDGTGASSTGNDYGRGDNWPQANIAEIGTAIERLRRKYRPGTVIIVGHSGGAAIAAVLLGMRPQLADAAILVGCPCDLVAWRAGRQGMPWISEDPMRWVDQVAVSARVIALTGDRDHTTDQELGRAYAERLKRRGVDAVFQLVPGAGHVDVLRSPAIAEATASMLRR